MSSDPYERAYSEAKRNVGQQKAAPTLLLVAIATALAGLAAVVAVGLWEPSRHIFEALVLLALSMTLGGIAESWS